MTTKTTFTLLKKNEESDYAKNYNNEGSSNEQYFESFRALIIFCGSRSSCGNKEAAE